MQLDREPFHESLIHRKLESVREEIRDKREEEVWDGGGGS